MRLAQEQRQRWGRQARIYFEGRKHKIAEELHLGCIKEQRIKKDLQNSTGAAGTLK